MTSIPGSRIKSLFDQALNVPPEQRESWLLEVCGDDGELFSIVMRLLDIDADSHDPLADVLRQSAQELDEGPLLAADEFLDSWRIIGELGSGGIGRVFLAERADDEYKRRVALKLLRGFPDATSLELLRQERQILADLDHPNIAALFDGGTTEQGQPYLVLEYIDGMPVDEWCAERETALVDRVRLLIKVCTAVNFAHQHLVLHRDIKPGNVLVTNDGTPKLLDFGIAKLMDENVVDSGAVTKVRYFTPHFASPEQQSGKPVAVTTDVFSLGRLIETVLQAGSGEEKLPRELQAIVKQATLDDPAERYPNVVSLIDDLRNWLGGWPLKAVAPRLGYRMGKFFLRHRVASVATATVLLVLMALFARVVIERRNALDAEAEARLAAANAEQVLGFITDMIAYARPSHAQGRDVTVAEVLKLGSDPASTARIEDPRLRSRMRFALGSAWQALEQWASAADVLKQAREDALHGNDYDDAFPILAAEIVTLTRQYDLEEASDRVELAKQLMERADEVEPGARADLLNSMGIWATAAGHTTLSGQWLEDALGIRLDLDPHSTAVASSLHNLAMLEASRGNYRAAVDITKRALDIKKEILGEFNSSYANSLFSLTGFLRNAGRYREARAAQSQMMDIRVKLLGSENPALAVDYNELATAHHDLGEYAQAIDNYEHAIQLDEIADPPDQNLFIYFNNLAAAYEDRGDLSTAERHFRHSIELREGQFGTEHPFTLRARHNLARIQLGMKQFLQAQEIVDEILTERIKQLGETHRDTLQTRLLAAQIAFAQYPQDVALLAALRRAGNAVLEIEPDSSLRALGTHTVLGNALLVSGDLDGAAVEIQSAIDGYRQTFGPEHPAAALLELELARIELMRGDVAGAAKRAEAQKRIIDEHMAPEAEARRKLSCVESGIASPDCWSYAP